MTAPIVWWHVQEDGASHAFNRFTIGHPGAMWQTLCHMNVFAFRVEREDRGPKCLACRMLTGGSSRPSGGAPPPTSQPS
ncbi:hypothetical protein Lesp02_70940 [Lentzea sp. NBRC 105346]|nr:hypothetical protein Lesp02_70940 [Lentzea sp. NBRC 105346]